MIFSGEGPMMSGTWQNPRTGDKFTVRDTYFEDNNFMVVAMDGRRFNYDMIQNYVQVENGVDLKPMAKQKQQPPVQKEAIKSALINEFSDGDTVISTNNAQAAAVLTTPLPTNATTTTNAPLDEDRLLIERLLKRVSEPTVDFKISWSKYPIKQMEMLDMMCVDVEKICNYYIEKIDTNKLKESIVKNLQSFIEKQFSTNADTLESVAEKTTTTKQTTTKKTTKK